MGPLVCVVVRLGFASRDGGGQTKFLLIYLLFCPYNGSRLAVSLVDVSREQSPVSAAQTHNLVRSIFLPVATKSKRSTTQLTNGSPWHCLHHAAAPPPATSLHSQCKGQQPTQHLAPTSTLLDRQSFSTSGHHSATPPIGTTQSRRLPTSLVLHIPPIGSCNVAFQFLAFFILHPLHILRCQQSMVQSAQQTEKTQEATETGGRRNVNLVHKRQSSPIHLRCCTVLDPQQ